MTEKDNQEGRLRSLGDKAASGNPGREIMGDGSDIQEQNQEGKQAWETGRFPQSGTQRRPRGKS